MFSAESVYNFVERVKLICVDPTSPILVKPFHFVKGASVTVGNKLLDCMSSVTMHRFKKKHLLFVVGCGEIINIVRGGPTCRYGSICCQVFYVSL